MPYRGTNSKRHIVHSKSRETIREKSKDRYLTEKKQYEHELSRNRETIAKAMNDGYHYTKTETDHFSQIVYMKNDNQKTKKIIFDFPENYNELRSLWE